MKHSGIDFLLVASFRYSLACNSCLCGAYSRPAVKKQYDQGHFFLTFPSLPLNCVYLNTQLPIRDPGIEYSLSGLNDITLTHYIISQL